MATRRRQPPQNVGEKRNLLSDCNNLGVPAQDFMQTFCRRCRNYTCTNAGWADSAWEARMRTQVDRLFEERTEADPNDPRYEAVRSAEFPSLLRQAIRLNIAESRGDWAIPSDSDVSDKMRIKADEINYAPPADEVADEKTSSKVDDALEALTGKRPKRTEPEQLPSGFVPAPEEDEGPPTQPVQKQKDPETPTQQVPKQDPPDPHNAPTRPVPLAGYNVPSQSGKIIGGPAPDPHDPWAVPKKPKNVVDVGATIKMNKKD